ncbi:MAG: hypothetical protein ACBZ72_03560 [Candidatus Bathyarchaeia archaeon]
MVIGLLSGLNWSLIAIRFVISEVTASIPIHVADMAKVIDPPTLAISDNITAVSAGEDIAVRYGAHAVISP